MADAWSKLKDGDFRKFCFMDVDLAGHSEIGRNNSTRDADATFSAFLEYIVKRVECHKGQVWNLAGDGGLFAFCDDDVTTMAEQGVNSALEILDGLSEFNKTKSKVKQQVRVRIAVHLGDAQYWTQTGRIQSKDVNFVAHLEKGGTTPDSVSISENVYLEIMNHKTMKGRFQYNGKFEEERVYTSAYVPYVLKVLLPYVDRGRISRKNREVTVLAQDEDPLSWPKFVEGCERLCTQIKTDKWKPDLIVAVNQGIAVAGPLKNAPQLSETPFGVSRRGEVRPDEVELLLPPVENRKKCRVLLIDFMMKTGGSLEAAKKALVKEGFDEKYMRAAVLILANIQKVPSGKRVELNPETFRQRAQRTLLTYKDGLKRIHYLSLVCTHNPIKPWSLW